MKNPEMDFRTASNQLRKQEVQPSEEWFYII